ncbi:MAG TPA: aldehyde dehydrogenase family protein [Actinomycetota bacterium]|jgi:acyl-CoA reductase-like NAD-dependent aldehyde dehydrogenase|nr:aldehyde dehydrogenase family protein [Actinomycetota bacterium]
MSRDRLSVRKTYKLYVGGAFPRSESGRSYPALDRRGEVVARPARASRKDLRDAVRSARSAWKGWAGATPYNRGQILYRVAELMEGRREQFVDELKLSGSSKAEREVDAAIDRCVWYAGWSDKVHHIIGTVNPVAGPYFNFTFPEPTGVVGVVAPEDPALLGLVSRLAPAVVSGNTAVVLASEAKPLPAVTLCEVLATSDVPPGVINVLTGYKKELVPWLASHMDVNAIDLTGVPDHMRAELEATAANNVKRVVHDGSADFFSDTAQSPYAVTGFMEMKTVWHPMGA